MAIHVQCPGCGSQFAAPDQLAGQRAQCNHCQSVVSVPHLPPPAANNSRQRLLVMSLGLAAAGMVVGATLVLGFLWINARQRRFVPPAPAMAVQAPQPVFTPEPPPPWHPRPMQQQASWLVTAPAIASVDALQTTKLDFPIAFERLILPRTPTRYAVGLAQDANGRPLMHRVDLTTCQVLGEPQTFHDHFHLDRAEASSDGRWVASPRLDERAVSLEIRSTCIPQEGLSAGVASSGGRSTAIRFIHNNLVLCAYANERDRLAFTLITLPRAGTNRTFFDPLIPASQVDLRSLALSPGGQFAALVWPQDRSIRIWNLDAGQTAGVIQLKIACAHTDLAWSPDGRRLALVDRGAAALHLAVFDMATGQPLFQTDHDQPSSGAADRYEGQAIDWSSDGRQLLAGGTQLFDAATGERVDSLRIIDLALAARPRRIIQPGVLLQCVAGTNSPWYVATQLDQWLASYQPPPMPVETAAIAPQTSAAKQPPAAPPSAYTIKSDPSAPKPVAQPAEIASAADPAANAAAAPAPQTPDAAWSLPLDPPAALPTFKSGRISLKIEDFDALVFPPTPSRFCLIQRSGAGERVRFMLDLATGKPIGKEVVAEEIRGSDVVVSSDGRYLAAEIHPSRHIGIWSFANGRPTCGLAPPKGEHFDKFTFVGPHRLVAFHAEDLKTHATIWDVRDGKNHGRMIVDGQWCSGNQLAIAPSPGGKYLAVVCEHRLKIVDPSGPKIVGERSLDSLREREFIRISGLNIDLSHIECGGLAWSPDGTRLALVLHSGLDGFLVCLDARTGGTVSQRVLQTRNLASDFGEVRHVEHNRVDWTWDSGAILLGGTRLYDAPTAKDLFTLAFSAREGDQPRRIIRAWDVLTVARDREGDYSLSTFPLSKEALAKAIEQVRGAGEAVDSLLPPLTVAKYDGAMPIGWNPPAAWTSLVDGVAPVAGLPDRIAIAEKDEPVDRVVFASPASAKLVVSSRSSKGDTSKAYVQQIDALSGKRAERIEVASAYQLADVSPDGQFALFRFHEGAERYERLDVVGLNPKRHIAGWRPRTAELAANSGGAATVGQGQSIVETMFVDAQHVLSLNESGRLVLWKLPECRAVWHAEGVDRFGPFSLSPGRKFLSLATAGRVLLVEALTGQALASLDLPAGAVAPRLAFRKDGQEIYLSWALGGQGGYLRRIDAATSRAIDERLVPFAYLGRDMYLAGHTIGDGGLFRSDNIALLNGSALVDLSRGVLLWRYAWADREFPAANPPDHRLWHWSADPPAQGSVQLFALDPYSNEVRPKSAQLKTADQFALAPGDKIRIVVDLDGAGLASVTAKLQAALREWLAAGRLVEDSAAPITLAVRGFERNEAVSFTRSNGQTISAQDLKIGAQLSITDAAGKVVWGFEFINTPAIDILNLRDEDLTKDLTPKKRQLVADRLLSADLVRSIPTVICRDPREILPGESLIGKNGLEPLPADRQLPPKPTGLERTGR